MEQLLEKRRVVLQKIGIAIYIAIYIVQILMYFVMKYAGLILHSTSDFIRLYMIRPWVINTVIVVVCLFVVHKSKQLRVKNLMEILMITLMIACAAYVHHVYSVLLVTFCIPIFLTIFLQDKIILNLTTLVCEIVTGAIALECFITKSGAYMDTYFIPTVVMIMIILFICRYIAYSCISIMNEQARSVFEAQKIAEESNRSKSVFLSNMSHEIRTPLNAILSFDTMILRESKEQEIREYAKNIDNSGQVLLTLINDILDLSKIESGKIELVEDNYDVASLLQDVSSMISVKAESKGLDFVKKIDSNLPSKLYGDETKIRQILVNILTNAVKYTESGSVTLTVEGEKQQGEIALHFEISDTGIGIKPEDMDKLFAKFERIEETRNKGIEGTGLGMSITTSFLSLMGSALKVDSIYGEGSVFSFTLIQKITDEQPIGDISKHGEQNISEEDAYKVSFTAEAAKVLVVDDSRMNRIALRGLLKKTKIHIDEASGGKECIELSKAGKYDIIFLDHMMPEMDGIETLSEMKKIDEFINESTPVIALTANAIQGEKEKYLQVGFTDYLSKPINPDRLEEMILKYLSDDLVSYQ